MAISTTPRNPTSRIPLAVLGATLAGALALGGLILAMGVNGNSATPTAPAAISVAARNTPAGVITYEVTGKGLFTSNGAGETFGTTTTEHLHAEGHVASPVESAPSPDGKWVAAVIRTSDGAVFLGITGTSGEQRVVAQLAGSDDPVLVAAGKGHARAVQGVPLVVAWSPDSSQLAFGSVSGEPFTLGILSHPEQANPYIRSFAVSGGYVGELAWSPNGKSLAVSTYAMDRSNHTVLLADPMTGYVNRIIDGCHITWAPDSEYFAIHRDPGAEAGAWVVSAADVHHRWAITSEPQAFPLTWRES